MELVVREIRTQVTACAIGFFQSHVFRLILIFLIETKPEQNHAPFGGFIQGLEVACGVFIVRGIARKSGAFERCNRFGEAIERDICTEHFGKLSLVSRNGVQTVDDLLMRLLAHFRRSLRWALTLCFK